MTKVCTKCGEDKPFSEYGKHKKGKHGLRSQCKPCVSVQNTAYLKNYDKRFWRYSMTTEDYNSMLEKQGGKCVCGATDPGRGYEAFCVDHDHSCCPGEKSCGKCVRGLLCHNCNVALGLLDDDVERMMGLASYLLSRENVLGVTNGN